MKKRKKPYSPNQQLAMNDVKKTLCIAIRNNQGPLRGRTAVERAASFGITMSRLTEVYSHQYDKLTINQLFHYLIMMNPNFKMQLLYDHYE